MRNLFGLIISFVFIVIVLISAKLFEKAGKEASRKYIHIVLSNWWIIAMVFFDSPIWASIGPLIFVFVNYVSYKFNLIKAMERDESQKDGLGTVYYALTLLILSIVLFGPLKNYKNIWGPTIGLAGIAVMGYGDALAAIIGKSVKSPSYTILTTTKTLAGSIAMFCTTFIILSGFLAYSGIINWFFKAISIAIIDTILEAISIKGTDNLTVPIATVFLLILVI
jgi:phytol kinase